MPLSTGGAFLWAAAGGVALEVVGHYKIRKSNFPQWLKTKRYWFSTAAMILVGGGLAFTYVESGYALHPLLALNVGAAAPLILERLSAVAPDISPGRID
jgi:hypothetical protein